MRRLLLAVAVAAAAAVPAAPAQAGVGACVVTVGFPVCAGTCSPGDTITVITSPFTATGTASCGGSSTSCTAFKLPCTNSTRTGGSGALSCSGDSPVVVCLVIPGAR